jgi:hypothetical protein
MIYVIIIAVFLSTSLFVNMSKSMPVKNKKQVPPVHYRGKIIVDLEKCYLLSSESPVESFAPDINEPWSSASDPEMYEHDPQKSIHHTIIVFEKDGTKFYSGPVDKDKTTLQYYLINKKQTTIYYDLNDPRNYFFDLSFLQE